MQQVLRLVSVREGAPAGDFLIMTIMLHRPAQAELSNLEAELEACIAGDDDAPAEPAQHTRTPGQPDPAADWVAARHHSLTPAPNKTAAGVSPWQRGRVEVRIRIRVRVRVSASLQFRGCRTAQCTCYVLYRLRSMSGYDARLQKPDLHVRLSV